MCENAQKSKEKERRRRRRRKGVRMNARRTREPESSIGRKGEAPRWSYDGNGVRHLTEDGKGWIVRKVGGEAG